MTEENRGVSPTLTPHQGSTWEAAMNAERATRSAMNRYREEITKPLYKALEDGTATIQQVTHAEDGWAPYVETHTEAVNAVIRTPAPDLGAIVSKIELGISDGPVAGNDAAGRFLRVLADDIRRIADAEGRT